MFEGGVQQVYKEKDDLNIVFLWKDRVVFIRALWHGCSLGLAALRWKFAWYHFDIKNRTDPITETEMTHNLGNKHIDLQNTHWFTEHTYAHAHSNTLVRVHKHTQVHVCYLL